MNSNAAKPTGRLERLMFRRVPLWLLFLFVLATMAGFVVFGALVKHRIEGGKRFPALAGGALAVASIPQTFWVLASETDPRRITDQVPALPDGLSDPERSSFVDDGYALIARFVPERDRSVVQLVRLSDGNVLREYAPDIADINRRSSLKTAIFDLERDRSPSRYRMRHPYLMPDGGIVFHGASPLVRIDACGKVMWTLDGIFHHSIERDADGNFWVPTMPARSTRPMVSETFREDSIAQVSADGRLLHSESVFAILERNGLSWLYEGRPYFEDPLHLNDIEPVLQDGPHWRRGDLFLSFNRLSAVMLYRPSTGRIVWWHQGTWSGQHDVDVLDDHRISVFDNHMIAGYPTDFLRGPNRILIYDFSSGQFTAPLEAGLRRHDIGTLYEGLSTPLANGDFMIEETQRGRLVRMSPEGKLRWQYIAADDERHRYLLNWSRYLDPRLEGAGIRAAANARCG